MEHRTLTDPRIGIVRENALATYLGLTGSVEGATITRPMAFTLVRGPGLYSFCNFAAGFDLKDGEADAAIRLLRSQAEECYSFYVFMISGDAPSDMSARLQTAGFERRQSLVSMSSTVTEGAGAEGLSPAVELDARKHAAEFMARQFFWKMPGEVRRAIADATALSRHAIWTQGRGAIPDAAVMLVELPASIGLFNLCVRPELRRQGLGSAIVRWVQARAAASGRPVVLQCEQELVPWYVGLGFEAVGFVEAYTLAPEGDGDILFE